MEFGLGVVWSRLSSFLQFGLSGSLVSGGIWSPGEFGLRGSLVTVSQPGTKLQADQTEPQETKYHPFMSQLDPAMEEITRVDEMIRNCLDESEEVALIEKKNDLMSKLCNVSSGDTITIANGLKFIRMKLEKEHPEAVDVIRMTKKLTQVASICAVPVLHCAVPPAKKKKRVASGPPYTRPPGAAPRGKMWSTEHGMWEVQSSADAEKETAVPALNDVEGASTMVALHVSVDEI